MVRGGGNDSGVRGGNDSPGVKLKLLKISLFQMKYVTTTTTNTLLGLCVFSGLLMTPLASAADEASAAYDNPTAKAGYSVGARIGAGLKSDDLGVSLEDVIAGLTDTFTGSPTKLSEEEQQAAILGLEEAALAKAMAERKAAGEVAKAAGEKFLTANKEKEGVKTLPSGLQYSVITEGDGDAPKATDTVTVNYKGTLVDGTVFDSSYDRGEPVSFPVNEVIPGWTEALQLMKPGAKWQLFVPADLAYGKEGAGNAIPPNAALVFDVELLKINS